MKTLRIFTIALGTVSLAFAGSAQQTSWSGGPGVTGPATSFGNSFASSSNIDWDGLPGVLMLDAVVTETLIDGSFTGAHSVHSADIDGDDDPDVIAAGYTINEVAWFENLDGIGSSWSKHVIGDSYAYAYATYADDIDGDGDCDVVSAAHDDDEITWWENDDGSGLSWTRHVLTTSADGASAVHTEDVDGDGDRDILSTERSGDDVTWWENTDGSGQVWIEHVIQSGFDGARDIYAGDIDGDGDVDVIAAAVLEDRVAWWENLDYSGTAWLGHSIDDGFNGACAVFLDDLDGDGDMDAMGAAVHQDEIRWWENADGVGTIWIPHTVAVSYDGAHSAMSADLDSDGDPDLLTTAERDDDVTWWENTDGAGMSWTEHVIDGNFDGAEWAWPVDIDDDGSLDVVAVAEYDNSVTLWDLSEYLTAGSLQSTILDTETDPLWDYLEWDSDAPEGTSVVFQLRASDDYTSMGPWSDSLLVPSLISGYIDDGDRYVQYRVLMSTTDPDQTPKLLNMMITWDTVGIEEGYEPLPPEVGLLPVSPNPTRTPVLIFGLPEPAPVELAVFDLSGRTVWISNSDFSAGYQTVQLDELLPGVYFCRMISGDYSGFERFVVIE